MAYQPLTDSEITFMQSLFKKYGHERSILSLAELDGFLTAIVSGPEAVLPSQWYPAIWGGEGKDPEWESESEFKQFMALVKQMLNDNALTLMYHADEFEALFSYIEDDEGVFYIVDDWCKGYMRGVNLAISAWERAPVDILQSHLANIALFAGEFDDKLQDISRNALARLKDKIEPAARALYTHFARQRSSTMPGTKQVQPNKSEKIGRNDPCPCGSGQKYKQCCLH